MESKKQLTQEQLNRTLWKICDTFRGAFDSSEYKNYILVFMFLKYLSDIWKDTYEKNRKEYTDEDLIRRMKRERFVMPEDCTFDYVYEHRHDSDIGEKIDKILNTIEDENSEKLEGVFRNISFNSEKLGQTKERNRRLLHLINDFAKEDIDFRSSRLGKGEDIIGNAYMYLIEKFASGAGKKGGEFYTPREVSELLAKLVQPKSNMRICDPACGSGSLLVKVAEEVGSGDFSLYGQESNGDTWALCKMNMFLHNMDAADIEWGDTINHPKLLENDSLMKFEIVVANPPFSLNKWGAEQAATDVYNRFHRGTPPKSKGDYAFISHMIEIMHEKKGRVAVIVPHGVLFRGGGEGRIRENLIKENLLEAVIGLPSNLFFGTGIPACILIYNRAKGGNNDVLFIDASREFEAGKNQNRLRDQDIEKIVSTYRTFQQAAPIEGEAGAVIEEKYAYRATLQEIEENDFNLNIPRYVDTFEEEKQIDIAQTQKKLLVLKQELTQAERKMDAYLKDLGF